MQSRRIPPGPGQESVWDYPRPPRLEDSAKHIQVVLGGVVIADTRRAKRVLETSHPPVYYIPPEDIQMQYLRPVAQRSFCEWKGAAAYYSIHVGDVMVHEGAWYYPEPTPSFVPLRNYVAFYPGRMEACYVDDERVQAQPGDFYGGWITNEIVGPFKGGAGSWGW
jgi:uncharacterized protein (DUF427 family)